MNGKRNVRKENYFFLLGKIRQKAAARSQMMKNCSFFCCSFQQFCGQKQLTFSFSLLVFPRKRGKKIAICQKKSPIYLLNNDGSKGCFLFFCCAGMLILRLILAKKEAIKVSIT